MKQILLIAFASLFSWGTLLAQQTVSGTVTDDQGEPLIGATILVQGTGTGTITDFDGNFSLEAAPDATLVISFTGYETRTIEVDGRSRVDVMLSAGIFLEGAVVTAMGIERERRELGYAITTIDGSDLAIARSGNALDALSGRVAGVRINSSSGTAGGSSNILIRGISAFGGGSPLFVVDGVPVSNSAFAGDRNQIISGGADVGNRAGDLNPDDIESISVLKGASAVALYGQRARDGVVVVTTKRARENRLTVDVNTSLRFASPFRLPDLQNEYASGNFGQYDSDNFLNGWGPKISEVEGQNFRQFPYDEERPLVAYPDNVKDFFETGVTFVNNVSISNRGESGDFRLSYTYFDENGIVPGNELNRNTVSINAGTAFTDNLRARAIVNYVRTEGLNRPRQGSNNPNILMSNVYLLPRTTNINDLKNNLRNAQGQVLGVDGNNQVNNPYWIIENNPFSNIVDRVYGSFEVNYDHNDWLTLTGRLGTDFYQEYRRNITAKETLQRVNGEFEDRGIYRRELNSDIYATVRKRLSDDISFTGIVGWNTNEIYFQNDRTFAADLLAAGVYNPANALSTNIERFESTRRLVGGFFDVGFGYRDFLYVNVTGRNDWSSTLPKDNRSFFYPGVSTSFIFTDAFNLESDILSFGKLRASYAQVGSDEAPYQLDFLFSPLSDVFTQFVSNNTYPFGGEAAFSGPATLPAGLSLKPQSQNTLEIGAELQFFRGRLGLDVAYYNTLTEDIIVSVALAQSTGFEAARRNAGSVRNEGVEILLSAIPVRTSNFEWETVVNFTRNVQTVETIAEGLDDLALTSGFSGLSIRAETGGSFGLHGAGWERSPDGQLVIDRTTGLRVPGARTNLGDIFPDYQIGFINRFSYGNFTLHALIDVSQGGVLFSRTVSGLRGAGLAEETLENRGKIFIDQGVNRVTDSEGNVTYVPNETPVRSMQEFWSNYTNNNNTEGSVFDADYIKLREISISYNLPREWLQRTFIREMSIGIEGRNLLLINSSVPHIDPEASFFGPSLVGGAANIEFYSVPTARSIGGNVKIRF
ncbi:MAG: SusC/RagA family TonB-linked outer membrane protein [Saprospirales bacterium]|nr:MAG: SusC/RagA family TonB-linked outer membrane protein [Saprospirales bacterium]